METTTINGKKNRVTTVKPKPKKKSKFTLFWEKHPNGIGTILDHEAVLQQIMRYFVDTNVFIYSLDETWIRFNRKLM